MLVFDDSLSLCEFDSVVREGTTLLLYSPHIMNDFMFRRYCDTFKQNLDRIVMISSLNHQVHVFGKTFHPEWITLSDLNYEWIKPVHDRIDSSVSLEHCVTHLRLQQLWRHGKLVGEWWQPLSNQWYEFKLWLSKQPNYQQLLQSSFNDSQDVAWLHQQLKINDNSLFISGIRSKWLSHKHTDVTNLLQWYRLIPNPSLKQLISEVNNAVS